MAANKRLINGVIGDVEIVKPQTNIILYDAVTGEEAKFTSDGEAVAAIESRKWVDSPAKVGKKQKTIEPRVNYAEKIAAELAKPDTPIDPTQIKKHINIRNRAELFATGLMYGIDFPQSATRKEMIKAIQKVRRKRGT